MDESSCYIMEIELTEPGWQLMTHIGEAQERLEQLPLCSGDMPVLQRGQASEKFFFITGVYLVEEDGNTMKYKPYRLVELGD